MDFYKNGVTKIMKKVTQDEDYKFGDYTKGTLDVMSFGVKSLHRTVVTHGSPLNRTHPKNHDDHSDDDTDKERAESEHFDEEVWLMEDELPILEPQTIEENPVKPNFSPDIIFIGGGPVGLWTAIQLKLYNPDSNILVFEKYSTYQRSHVLLLSKSSFKNRLNKYATNKHGADLFADMIANFEKVIRTNDLEIRLIEFAKSLGIQIAIENITSIDSLRNRYPSTKVIIGNRPVVTYLTRTGSDGSHSLVQKEVFRNELQERESLQCIVDLKYEVYGKGVKLDPVSEGYPTLKIMNHVAEEHIMVKVKGISPITLRLLIDTNTYNRVKDASFKSPFRIPTHKNEIGEKLLESITIWLNVKKVLKNENRVPGSEKLSALNLSVYQSKQFGHYDIKHNKVFFLVGDSAFGVPYFRSLNNGLLSGTKLAEYLSVLLNDDSKANIDRCISEYSDFMRKLAGVEISRAKTKQHFFKLGQLAIKMNGALPWQVINWSSKQKEEFRTMDPQFVSINNSLIYSLVTSNF